MLRLTVLVMLVGALVAGLVFAGEVPSAAMACEQVSFQQGGDAGGCGGEGMGTACALPCPAGACIASTMLHPQPTPRTAQPFTPPTLLASDRARAPDTAPPKHLIS